MKKKLEAELISIAHRVLKLKNKDDVKQLQMETLKLYEKLSILLFIEENPKDINPFTKEELEIKIEAIEIIKDSEIIDKTEGIIEEKILVAEMKEVENELVFETPVSETKTEITIEEEVIIEPEIVKNTVELDNLFDTTKPIEFDKLETEQKIESNNKDTKYIEIPTPKEFIFEKVNASNLNDSLKKNFTLNLNDKIAFESILFGGSTEDFNRVISQISTFTTKEEALNFIEEMVKPDYNFWKGFEEIEKRFIDVIESKFI